MTRSESSPCAMHREDGATHTSSFLMVEALDDVSRVCCEPMTTITARWSKATPPRLAHAAATACSTAVHAMAAARAPAPQAVWLSH
jgi:hypothetical protein